MISNSAFHLSGYFDCVVMLTWSNWHTEMRSNRYHYATRFAKNLPVIFVQPDSEEVNFHYEDTEIDNIVILHIYQSYGPEQSSLMNLALNSEGLIKPLLWIYNYLFLDFIAKRYSPLKIYHATEDYFAPDFLAIDRLDILRSVLSYTHILVTVSEGVNSSYINNGRYYGEHTVIPNGCDFKFWVPSSEDIKILTLRRNDDEKIVFYQGNINNRLDFALIDDIVTNMLDWAFWFCGEIDSRCDEWKDLLQRHKNIKYFGKLQPEDVRELAYKSVVGIIPFVQNDWIIERSLPLKAFEYLACGLPVVSVPIKALDPFSEVFQFAESSKEFIDSIRHVASSRYDATALDTRLEAAKKQDYDIHFETLQSKMTSILSSRLPNKASLNVLTLYDDRSTHINTLREHLESFGLFSHHQVFYAIGTHGVECEADLSLFDVVVIHYSIRVSLDWHLEPSYAEAMKRFGGLKILFIQDEYDTTETTRNCIKDLGIHVVYTCVPRKYIEEVYPASQFCYVEFVHTLTGYVPIRFETHRKVKPISEREVVLGYRGRELPYWYGSLGREKLVIAQEMRQICEERGIPNDIEWKDARRIYGKDWYDFLENCKATLGTESGSNVFDDYGDIRRNTERALEERSSITYEEVYDKYVTEHEGKVLMNQISPKVFEAIAFKTALVLFEGNYSGVVSPDIHYIPLKKDFTNIVEVLEKLSDDSYLEKLTNRAYSDIIKSGQYSYRMFIQEFDQLISQCVTRGNGVSFLAGVIGSHDYGKWNLHVDTFSTNKRDFVRSMLTNTPLPTPIPAMCTERIFRDKSLKIIIAERLSKYPLIFNLCRALYRSPQTALNKLKF